MKIRLKITPKKPKIHKLVIRQQPAPPRHLLTGDDRGRAKLVTIWLLQKLLYNRAGTSAFHLRVKFAPSRTETHILAGTTLRRIKKQTPKKQLFRAQMI